VFSMLLVAYLKLNRLHAFQAKEHEIYDIQPFLKSKLFSTNGYKVAGTNIEKAFRND
jgi:DNA replication licensing factor MCM2